MTVPNSRPCRAAVIANKLIEDGVCAPEALAEQLVTSVEALRGYCSGQAMPLERQLCLALVLMQLPAPYPRLGFALRGQIQAAMRFDERVKSGELRV